MRLCNVIALPSVLIWHFTQPICSGGECVWAEGTGDRQRSACSPVAILPLVQTISQHSEHNTDHMNELNILRRYVLRKVNSFSEMWTKFKAILFNLRARGVQPRVTWWMLLLGGGSAMDISHRHPIWSSTLLSLANYLSRVREMDLMCFPADTCSGSGSHGWVIAF